IVVIDMNYKGIILRAFEQFRLKSCIDFKPRAAEDFYISVESREGCWSYVGRIFPGGQPLSIGYGCGIKAIVEHEFLHALGFLHEQSRYDRDDYVTIKFENIIKGKESNFNKYGENVTTTQGTPYDYYSVMHYDKDAFSYGNGSTIITKLPEFQDVIGQRLDISEYDAIELNKLYKCSSSISFLDHCSFEDESLCQMSVCSAADYGWQRVKSVSGINVTDHTYLGKEQNGTSFFMHFSTEGRNEGDTARMESKTMTPKRDCKVQCLQFYYYHSGNESDQLNIWIREYQNEADNRGTLRLMDQITEFPGNYWKLHQVSLNANKTFQVVFEARKGAGNSSGGFSLDDINISATECPHTWQIRDFSLMESSIHFSPLYYSSDGYRFQAALEVYPSFLAMYVHLVSGAYDDQLQWPCPWRQITFQMLDQNPHIQKRMSSELSITTDPTSISSNGIYDWDNPRKNGTRVTIGNETVYVGLFSGYPYVITSDDLTRREFIKGGDIIFLFNMQGKESNFNKYSENVTTTQGTPYDYYSVMHYDKNAFSNGYGSTIITKLPEFQNVIGQRLDISEYDAIELNKLYKCSSSISFLDHCSFEDESLCQMSVCSAADYGWQRVKSVSGINVTDHTYLGKEQNGTSFFMHFSTKGRKEGDAARMESKTMTPKRDCKVQCLQFYYYHSGNESDQLNIWIREYQNEADNRGTLRLMDQITELPGNYWKLHHVSLNANKTFQVIFEARKRAGSSSGGFSLDDINISETECPHTWQISNFDKFLNNAILMSPLYYSSDGYRFQARLLVIRNLLIMYVRLVSGAYDDHLQWPCPWRQITFQILDQNPHIQRRMSSERSITTDPSISSNIFYWGNPRNSSQVVIGKESVFVGTWVYIYAITKDELIRREFIKGGHIIFLLTMQDISGLLQNDSLPCPKVTVKNIKVSPDASVQQGPCAR
ncbi:Meprin A subunit beta, partial [Anabarilius grahami]